MLFLQRVFKKKLNPWTIVFFLTCCFSFCFRGKPYKNGFYCASKTFIVDSTLGIESYEASRAEFEHKSILQ
jgi:hypothetical protein